MFKKTYSEKTEMRGTSTSLGGHGPHEEMLIEENENYFTWGNKRCPKPSSTIAFICENKFNPFDSVPLATLRFRNFMGIRTKADFAKFL